MSFWRFLSEFAIFNLVCNWFSGKSRQDSNLQNKIDALQNQIDEIEEIEERDEDLMDELDELDDEIEW